MCRSNNTFELTWAKPVQDIPSPHVNPLFVGGATVSPMASSPAALGAAASMAQAAAMVTGLCVMRTFCSDFLWNFSERFCFRMSSP